MMLSWNDRLILGSVLTWHSYTPESLPCADRICSVQFSERSGRMTVKRWSDVYVSTPAVRMCRSRFRIHDTYKQQGNNNDS